MATHYDIVKLGSVASTQDEAVRRHRDSGRRTLVVADHQTRGRGRQGRSWDEPGRAMFSSFAFDTNWPASVRPVITLCTAVALSDAIAAVFGIEVDIKWPNDLLLGDAKIAGILTEVTGDIVTVGCGANLWWPEPPPYAKAICDNDPGADVANTLARHWVDRLLGYLEAGPGGWPRASYVERSSTLGRSISWESGSGHAAGINDTGALIVETADGATVLTAGEVHTRKDR